jgi:adenosylmethionine-8-amino-7-oxononanoate aminotransferase
MTVNRSTDYAYHRDWRKPLPLAVRGEGVHVYDAEGRRYLDAVGGVYVVNVGHGITEVADAMAEQARKIAFPYAGSFTTEAELDLAEEVIAMAPPGFKKVFFVAGGSEANEVAIKLARKYQLIKNRPGRWRVIGRWQSFHGATMATLSASGKVARRADFQPYLLNFPHIAPPYCYRCPWGQTYPGCGLLCAESLERLAIEEDIDTIMALIAEPITGAASGAITPPPEYYPKLREICDRHDLLLIVDEVITGFGRTGANFAINHWGVVPDIITCGKGIGSGYVPLGAVLIHEKVYDTFMASPYTSIFTGYTYAGHPVTCAAGLAVIRYLKHHNLVAKAREDGAWFFAQAQRLRRHRTVGDIRGKGLLMGIELVADATTGKPFEPSVKFHERVVDAAWNRGLIVRGESGTIDGHLGEHLLISPPLVATREEMASMLELLDQAIEDAEGATL